MKTRAQSRSLHVRYKEEGAMTTPFRMVVLNEIGRFHLVQDVIDRLPQPGSRAAYAKQAIRDVSSTTRATSPRTARIIRWFSAERGRTKPGHSDQQFDGSRQRMRTKMITLDLKNHQLTFSLVLLALCLLPLACRSGAKRTEVACTCGQPETDFRGCAHHLCSSRHRNPENPDCVCGTLSIPK